MLNALFKRRRCYAQLSPQGLCLALWELNDSPRQGHWVEVCEMEPRWIGKPLPASARVIRTARRNQWRLLPA